MPHKISIFGLGYVGSVSAGCLASKGNHVTGVDVNPDKVRTLASGNTPIVEPDVPELIRDAVATGMLSATTDSADAVLRTDISFICVGTPSARSGRLDLGHVEKVCLEIGAALKHKSSEHLVVLRSTALPGTTENLVKTALEKASGKQAGRDFYVAMNPEFLREGSAVKDFFEPTITVIGAFEEKSFRIMRDLYSWVPGEVFETNPATAEMVKYSCNAFHAVKVAFANEIGTICKATSVDTDAVTRIFVSDTKLNVSAAYLKPGFAFGGSCLPKDVRAITYRAKELDLSVPLLSSLLPSNEQHIERAVSEILSTGKREIGFLGLSFKSGTDDLRESPYVLVIKRLIGEGRSVRIWDSNVTLGRLIGSNRQYIESEIPHIGSLLTDNLEIVVGGSEVVVLATSAVERTRLEALLRPNQLLVDLVNLAPGRRPAHVAYQGICW
jgi:GDP-mannose 6-dehydrogenase